MRISFLAVLAVALLVGLGVVVMIRALGLLSKPAPPPVVVSPPPVPLPPPLPMVLVPLRPLFMGDAILPGDLGARPVSLGKEYDEYKAHSDEYLMAIPQVAYYRFVTGAIPAMRPLRKSDLQDLRKPESLGDRMLPGTRAVNVTVAKDRAAGGLIGRSDWVDVYVTINVARTDNPTQFRREGLLVPHAHVVATRNSLFPLYYPNPSDEIQCTLSMNPYRAALLEYAKTLGAITLVPVPEHERIRLDELAKDASKDPEKALTVTVGDPNSMDGLEELARIRQQASGGFAIGPDDLARALMLKPISPLPPPPHSVELFHGVSRNALLSFPLRPFELGPPLPAAEYLFGNPFESGSAAPAASLPSAPTPRAATSRPATAPRGGAAPFR